MRIDLNKFATVLENKIQQQVQLETKILAQQDVLERVDRALKVNEFFEHIYPSNFAFIFSATVLLGKASCIRRDDE